MPHNLSTLFWGGELMSLRIHYLLLIFNIEYPEWNKMAVSHVPP